jgi:hypothetical protein
VQLQAPEICSGCIKSSCPCLVDPNNPRKQRCLSCGTKPCDLGSVRGMHLTTGAFDKLDSLVTVDLEEAGERETADTLRGLLDKIKAMVIEKNS